MFPIKVNPNKINFKVYQSDNENNQDYGIERVVNISSIHKYKGIIGLSFNKENYEISKKNTSPKIKRLFQNGTNGNEQIYPNNYPTQHDSINSMSMISKDLIVLKNFNSEVSNKKTKGNRLYSMKKSAKYSLKEKKPEQETINSELNFINNDDQINFIGNDKDNNNKEKDIFVDVRLFETNRTEKASEYEYLKIINEENFQKYIFDFNYHEIYNLLLKFEENQPLLSKLINGEDVRGNAPLFLIIYLREIFKNDKEKKEILKKILVLLLENKVLIRIRNDDKRTPLEEAISYGDIEVVELLYNQALINKARRVFYSKDKANSFLSTIPNFYMEMKWEVNIPFLSYFCPSDTCKIWKQGSNIRMDYTFMRMKGVSTVRAPSSFIFFGETKQNYLINWETKTMYDQFEALEKDEISLIIDDLMNGTRLNSEFKLKNCKLTPAVNWRGKPVIEKINKYNTQMYNVKIGTFFDIHHNIKIEYTNLDKETYFDYSKVIHKKITKIQSTDESNDRLAKNLKIENEMIKKQIENLGKTKEKNQSAFVNIAENFPLKTSHLVNLISSLSSANEIVQKIKEFLKDPEVQIILGKNGFPIKIKIPINMLISVTVGFEEYKESVRENEFDSLFSIPEFIKKVPRKEMENLKNDFKKRIKYINMNL